MEVVCQWRDTGKGMMRRRKPEGNAHMPAAKRQWAPPADGTQHQAVLGEAKLMRPDDELIAAEGPELHTQGHSPSDMGPASSPARPMRSRCGSYGCGREPRLSEPPLSLRYRGWDLP
eukprot:1157244-Pelagomonas_calceolata.AAC.4